ncbi:hypothetical protein KIN20_019657 [Parelaphostrongylus tenuis]|uniref:SCP domain-containing protein n=1 Tax=Parelaphostrongylus tenuis TaxID=148309 RepID=A0AAD5MLD0_PARTN|nr:hypothetical protein KIN20_019657 [Parelaphostrongylus tenuis]
MPCQYDEDCVAFSPAYCESALCVNASRPTIMALTSTTPVEERVTTPRRSWTTTPDEEWTTTTDDERATTPRRRWTTTSDEERTTTPGEEWTTVSNDPSTTAAVSINCSTAFDAAFRKTAIEEHNEFRCLTLQTLRTVRLHLMSNTENQTKIERARCFFIEGKNRFRSLVARGLEANGELSEMNVPLSSRMNLLEYDCTAEQYALNHVKLCDKQLSPEACRPGYKENIHIYELGSILRKESLILQNVIQNWAGQLKDSGIPPDMIFTRRVSEYERNKVDTVTKIIWGTNTKVGCATHKCDDFYFTSCMYEDRVNVVGENIYNIGPTCSECPRASECFSLKGLCPSSE